MSSPNNPQDPYGSPEDPDRSSGAGSSDAGSSGSTSYGSGSTPPGFGSQSPAYGSQPPAYGAQPPVYGSQPNYGSTPPAYGGGYGGSSPYGQQGGYGYPKNSLAVWSLVLSLVGFFLCGPLTAIPALVVGSKSRKAVANGEANNGGMALAGIIISWVTIVFWVIGLILFFTVIGGLAGYQDLMESTSATTGSF